MITVSSVGHLTTALSYRDITCWHACWLLFLKLESEACDLHPIRKLDPLPWDLDPFLKSTFMYLLSLFLCIWLKNHEIMFLMGLLPLTPTFILLDQPWTWLQEWASYGTRKKYILSLSETCSKLLCLMDWVQTLSSLAFKTLVYLPRPAFSSSPFPISSPSCTGLLSVVTMCSCTSCSLYSMSCCFPVLEWIVQPYKS